MGKITVHEFISLDGVIENPSWTMDYPFDPRMGQAIGSIMGSSQAMLLGRRTYEMFAPAWSGRTAEQDPGAPFMNDTKKHVVTSTLSSADWSNSEIFGPYSADGIRALKEQTEGNLYVSGSGQLVEAMLADSLVDELHLFVFPIALGSGQRLFSPGSGPIKLRLGQSDAYDSGVVHLTYLPAT